jgi:hypothetical protein
MQKSYGSWVVGAAVLLTAAAARADSPDAKSGAAVGHLKEMVGTWEATVEIAGAQPSKGTMVYKLEMNSQWLVGRFTGDFGGMPFSGMGLDTYEPNLKKYVSVWVDSMSHSPLVMRGDYDEATHTVAMTGKGPDQSGKMVEMKSTLKIDGKDGMTFTLTNQENPRDTLTIRYKRKS